MSLNRIAASTACRRTGCMVISQTRAGSRQALIIEELARSRRYSGSDLPACRMNHTGTRAGRTPRAAASRAASGRVRRYDPDGEDAWGGLLRLVAYVRAELDAELAADPLLPEVTWSWLTDALAARGADHTALGGTVTDTSSARFGEIAGPARTDDLELRASWTPLDPKLTHHAEAFCDLMASVVGLPPVGIAMFGQRRSG